MKYFPAVPKGASIMRELFLTFDTEDFISPNSIPTLHSILESLRKNELDTIFFITGHMAEKLQDFAALIVLLNEHTIGYHSSSHSVHPTIFEFTDTANYENAYRVSIQRETSHINPLTGAIEGKGGITALRHLFPRKEIVVFRAPGNCWSPPHLEALRDLGIRYDFSTSMSRMPVDYKGITFYPYSILGHWEGKLIDYRVLSISIARRAVSVATIHPSLCANRSEWDLIYLKSNPINLVPPIARSPQERALLLRKLDMLFRRLKTLQETGIIKVTGIPRESKKTLTPSTVDVEKCYQRSMKWAKRHGYQPKFLRQHFLRFFEKDFPNCPTSV